MNRLEKITGISPSLQERILREFKPDQKSIEYYGHRLKQLSDKYYKTSVGNQTDGCPEYTSKITLKRNSQNIQHIIAAKARRLILNPSKS